VHKAAVVAVAPSAIVSWGSLSCFIFSQRVSLLWHCTAAGVLCVLAFSFREFNRYLCYKSHPPHENQKYRGCMFGFFGRHTPLVCMRICESIECPGSQVSVFTPVSIDLGNNRNQIYTTTSITFLQLSLDRTCLKMLNCVERNTLLDRNTTSRQRNITPPLSSLTMDLQQISPSEFVVGSIAGRQQHLAGRAGGRFENSCLLVFKKFKSVVVGLGVQLLLMGSKQPHDGRFVSRDVPDSWLIPVLLQDSVRARQECSTA
jgi:hypothetical protein